jgi:DegV family protein with EDD domain
MKKIAWITDSTAYISKELKNHPDVYVLNTTLNFNGKEFKDQEITAEELYQLLKAEKSVPKTSQPPIGECLEVYEKVKNEYDAAIAIHVSSLLSGTFSTSKQAANMVDFPITLIDSKVISYPLTDMLTTGMKAHEEGASFDEVVAAIEQLINKYETYVLIGNLDQLHKSGRMNAAQYYLGSILNVKPIIELKDGTLDVVEKVRTEKKALKRLIEKLTVNDQASKVFILHCNAEEKAEAIKVELEALNRNYEIAISPLSSTVGVHTGEGTVALSWK